MGEVFQEASLPLPPASRYKVLERLLRTLPEPSRAGRRVGSALASSVRWERWAGGARPVGDLLAGGSASLVCPLLVCLWVAPTRLPPSLWHSPDDLRVSHPICA